MTFTWLLGFFYHDQNLVSTFDLSFAFANKLPSFFFTNNTGAPHGEVLG